MNKFFILVLLSSAHLYTGDSLTPAESACFDEFDRHISIRIPAFASIKRGQREILTNGTTFEEKAQEVTHALQEYAKAFHDGARRQSVPLKNSQEFLVHTLIKMRTSMQSQTITTPTDRTTARMYVFSRLLNTAEQASVRKENYIKDPQAAHQTLQKVSVLLAEELIKLGIITPEQKDAEAEGFFKKKISELDKAYKNA